MPDIPPDFISFEDAERLADQFELILKRFSIPIVPGRPLEHSLLLLHRIKKCHEDPSTAPPWPEFSSDAQEALGTLHLMRLVIRNENRPGFAELIPHLELLNKGEAVQTKAASPNDEASNKILELITALAALESGTGLRVDHPVRSSKGKNPDVLITMEDGLLWGFACKAVCGDAPDSLFQLIQSGVHQIENSPAQIGLVLLSFKNQFPHEEFLPSRSSSPAGEPTVYAYRDKRFALKRMQEWVEGRFHQMYKAAGREAIYDIFLRQKALPGVVVSQETVTSVLKADTPILSVLSFLHLVQLEFSSFLHPTRFDRGAMNVIAKLNKGFRIQ